MVARGSDPAHAEDLASGGGGGGGGAGKKQSAVRSSFLNVVKPLADRMEPVPDDVLPPVGTWGEVDTWDEVCRGGRVGAGMGPYTVCPMISVKVSWDP